MNAFALDTLLSSGQSIALWGWGREGRAAYHALRMRSALRLTLFCTEAEAMDASRLNDPALSVETDISAAHLSAFDLIIKSPGISPYRADAIKAAACGTRLIGGTAIWFASRPEARTICVTGTKGKSTTAALLAHLLRSAGLRTALAGNIGLPLLELVDAHADYWVIELSSYQTRDVALSGVRPEIAILTNLFSEHLDWHGDEARYKADKLALLTEAKPGIVIIDANAPQISGLQLPDSQIRWFSHPDGWHTRNQWLYHADRAQFQCPSCMAGEERGFPLLGQHNRENLCAALTAIDALGLDAAALVAHAATFTPLPHRLQVLGERGGITWVNDSISTTPYATLAALEVYRGQRIALILGGFDRHLDWTHFATAIQVHPPHAIILSGQTRSRLDPLLSPLAGSGLFQLYSAAHLGEAVTQARATLGSEGGIVLLSPGAPSFDAYHDYTVRGHDFAELAGFDQACIHSMAGMGII